MILWISLLRAEDAVASITNRTGIINDSVWINGEGSARRSPKPTVRCESGDRSAGTPLLGPRWISRLQIRLLRPPTRTLVSQFFLAFPVGMPRKFFFIICIELVDWIIDWLMLQAREEMCRERLRYLEAMVTHYLHFLSFSVCLCEIRFCNWESVDNLWEIDKKF